MKVVAVTVAGLEDGSTKFRLGQYLPRLVERGIHVQIFHRADVTSGDAALRAAWEADLEFIQKTLFRLGLERKFRKIGLPLVYDFDDAIWTRPVRRRSFLTRMRQERRLHFWLRNADLVLPANHYLAAYARRFSSRVQVFPMAIDTETWRPARSSSIGASEFIAIGWAGSPGNLPYLAALTPHLRRITDEFPHVRVRVYCGRKPDFFDFPFDYVPYSPGTEAAFAQTLDLGLLPLPDSEHARGKSPIKALQYLACEVPVIGNFVGASHEICLPEFSMAVSSPEQWVPLLRRVLTEDRERLRQMGRMGRRFVEQHHSLNHCAGRLSDLIRELVEAWSQRMHGRARRHFG